MIYKIVRKLKERKGKKTFLYSSIADASTVFMPGAKCENTGDKSNITIKKHCTLGCLLQAKFGGKISIGENTYIGPGSIIQSKQMVNIGSSVMISNNVIIVDNNNHPTDPDMRYRMSMCDDFLHDELWSWKYAESKPIVVENKVWIGRDSRILKGVTLGEGSIIAMGAVVTKDVPPYTVVAGNPARVVKKLDARGKIDEENKH